MDTPTLWHADGTLASILCDGVVLVARVGVTGGETGHGPASGRAGGGEKCSGWCWSRLRNPVPAFSRRCLCRWV